MIDILTIEPTVISRDLKGKYLLIYGKPKTGKTTMASRFPKNLLIAFEKGYNAIDGIKAVDINKWSEFRQVLRQLEKPEAQAMYDTITIDTTTIAYEMCEQFVCSQNGVQSIRDIPWGQGWALTKKEFETCLRKITMLGYGLVLISHIETRKEKTADDSEIEILAPSMPKRCYEVVNQIVDIIGYIATEWDDDGNSQRWGAVKRSKWGQRPVCPSSSGPSSWELLPPSLLTRKRRCRLSAEVDPGVPLSVPPRRTLQLTWIMV